jgi:hypothetical protein
MAITVKHSKVSTIPDAGDSDLVRPSDWNADHTLTGTIDISNGGTGQTTANAAFNALAPSQIGNTGKYLTTDGTNSSWSVNPLGDVVGPASSTDNAIARFDSTTGKLLQNSVVIVGDTGSITGVNALTAESLTVNNNATLGSSNTDTLDVNARITTDLEPNANNAKDIGTNGRNWRDGFFGRTLNTVNLGATGVATFSAGTVSAPAITTTGDTNTGIYFPAADTIAFTEGGVEAMRIDSSGRVGIGTSSPTTILNISSSTNTYQTIQSTDANSNVLTYYKNSAAVSDGFYVGFNADEEAMLWQTENNAMRFGTNSTERMRITSTGNVGIGTSSPAYKLDVVGNTQIRGNISTDLQTVSAWTATSRAYESSSYGAFSSNDGTGNVYVSTNAYESSDNNWKRVVATSAGLYQINFTGAHIWSATAAGVADSAITWSERMRITSTGNVGIGTSSPASNLTVKGNVGIIRAEYDTNTSQFTTLNYDGVAVQGAQDAYWLVASGRFHAWYTGSSERMRIDSSGNVGIGTSSPTARLGIPVPEFTDSSTNGMIRFQNPNVAADGCIQSYFVSGSGTDIYIGANSFINTSGTASRFSGSFPASAINIRRDGDINFQTNTSSGSATTRMTVTSAGVLSLNQGQIEFPATQVPSANANTLDDYEEGTWTPSVGGTATYTVQTGQYTKIGNFVKLKFHLQILLLGTGSTTTITGMPFTPTSSDPAIVGGVVCYAGNLATAALSLGVYCQSSGNIAFFTRDSNSTAATTQAPAVIGNGFDVYAEISYMV